MLADRVQSDGRACIVVCNKWDLVENKTDASYNKAVAYAKEMLSPVKWAEVVFTSAKTGQRCTKVVGGCGWVVAYSCIVRKTHVTVVFCGYVWHVV